MSFPGVKTGRNGFLIDIDIDRLKARIGEYFDPALSHEEIARRYPAAMKDTSLDARATRDALLARGGPNPDGFVRHAYRPLDNRWLYWEADGGLLDRPRRDYRPHAIEGNSWLSAAQHVRKSADEPQASFTRHIGASHMIERGAHWFPAWLRGENGGEARANLSGSAHCYLERLGATAEDLFHHVLSTLHDPAYREANAGALRMEWPRIPLPGWPDGGAKGAADALAQSAARGRELARLLDPEAPVPGVTQAPLRPDLAAIAVPATVDGRNMAGGDFALAAGWGRLGAGGAVMPGQGRVVERAPTRKERAANPALGDTTLDVHLNDRALLAQRPRRRMELQTRRLPSAQKVAVLPRTRYSGAEFVAGRGREFRRYGKAGRGAFHREPTGIVRALTGPNSR